MKCVVFFVSFSSMLFALPTNSYVLPRSKGNTCKISLNTDFSNYAPLLIGPDKNIIYPNQDDAIVIKEDEKFILSCEPNYFRQSKIKAKSIEVACNSKGSFSYQGEDYHFRQLECKKAPVTIVKKITSEKCLEKYEVFEIGFEYTSPKAEHPHYLFGWYEYDEDDENDDEEEDDDSEENIDATTCVPTEGSSSPASDDTNSSTPSIPESSVSDPTPSPSPTETSSDDSTATPSEPTTDDSADTVTETSTPSTRSTLDIESTTLSPVDKTTEPATVDSTPSSPTTELVPDNTTPTTLPNERILDSERGKERTDHRYRTSSLSERGTDVKSEIFSSSITDYRTSDDRKVRAAEISTDENNKNHITSTSDRTVDSKTRSSALLTTDNSATKNTTEIDNGKEFIKVIKVCFDRKEHRVVFAVHSRDYRMQGRQKRVKRPPFRPDIFNEESIDVNYLYTKKSQIKRLTTLLGSQDLAHKYIQNDDHFLARGHLSPKADFTFGHEQIATFYYVNVAPQWQTFNAGNWVNLEESVRKLTEGSNDTLTIYTGTHGVITLPDINNKQTEFYLGEHGGKPIIPVPTYYWKVIYNADKSQGIAVVGVNNPYHEKVESLCICEDICHIYPWIDWNISDNEKGFMFCCVLEEFQKKFVDLKLV